MLYEQIKKVELQRADVYRQLVDVRQAAQACQCPEDKAELLIKEVALESRYESLRLQWGRLLKTQTETLFHNVTVGAVCMK